MNKIAIVAAKEFRDCLASRWLVYGSLLFALLALAVFFGTAAIGGALHYQPLATVAGSLASLTAFVLPLLAVLLGYDAFVGEQESGTLLLMLTYPLTRTQWLAGKLAGQAAALAVVLVAGFAVLPAVQLFLPVPYTMAALAVMLAKLVGTGWMLGVVFLLVSYWVSLIVRSKAQALSMLLLVWFATVLLYDLALLVAAVAGADAVGRTVLVALMAANPASAFRMLNQTTGTLAGGQALLAAVPAVWAAVLWVLCRTLLAGRRL